MTSTQQLLDNILKLDPKTRSRLLDRVKNSLDKTDDRPSLLPQRTPEEQMERNRAAMAWLERKMNESITAEEAEFRERYFETFKQLVDAHRPVGQKLYAEE